MKIDYDQEQRIGFVVGIVCLLGLLAIGALCMIISGAMPK